VGNIKYSSFIDRYDVGGAYHWNWYKNKARYRNHVHYLKEWIKEKSVLDVGAGDGLIPFVLGIKGVDNNMLSVKLARSLGADVDYGDAHKLPYDDESFDSVLLTHTLEHLQFPLVALSEARRVLRKFLYIVSPENEDDFHITGDSLKEMVEKIGFELVDAPIEPYGIHAKFKKV